MLFWNHFSSQAAQKLPVKRLVFLETNLQTKRPPDSSSSGFVLNLIKSAFPSADEVERDGQSHAEKCQGGRLRHHRRQTSVSEIHITNCPGSRHISFLHHIHYGICRSRGRDDLFSNVCPRM